MRKDRKIRAAIFDVDGTLLDSMPIWQDIGARYLESAGREVNPGTREALSTMSLEQGAAYLKENYNLTESVSEIIRDVLKIVENFYRFEAELKPGVTETLKELKDRGIRMVVATSGNKELAAAALKRNGIAELFEKIFTCTETGAGKDQPDIYLEAAGFLGSSPEETLVFEDALHAAETAKKAGFTVGGVYDESNAQNISRMKKVCDFYCEQMNSKLLW